MPDQDKQKQAHDFVIARRNRAKQLATRLARTFNMLEQSPPFQDKRRIVLCMSKLYHACISYEIDIERWKPFHDILIPDNHKRAAFIFKWLSKMQPIQLLSCIGTDAAPYELGANGYFAMLGALGELHVDMKEFSVSPEAKVIYYTAMYREIIPESWAIIFCLLEKAYPAK